MKKFIAIAAALTLAACAGAGSGSSLVPQGGDGSTQSGKIPLAIAIPLPKSASASARTPKYVSSGTQSASVKVSAASGTSLTVFDLSSASTSCTTAGSQRTCTITVIAPVGTDAFTITTYDQAPVGSTIPSTAHQLGTTTFTLVVTPGANPSATVVISATVGSFSSSLGAFATTPADGAAHTIALLFSATDASGQPLPAGQSIPFSNPLTVTITETGGSGHASLLFNGTPSGTSASLQSSSDTISAQYDGGGSPGYSFTINAAATGLTTQTLQISPLFVGIGAGGVSHSITLNGTASTLPFTISEAGAPSTQTYSATGTNCTNIATIGATSGGGATASFTVTGSTQPSATGCVVDVTDGSGTTNALPVTNTPVTGSVPIGGTKITEFGGLATASGPWGITIGADGNVWFTEHTLGNVGVMNTSGGVLHEYPITSAANYLYGLTSGPDGNIWVTDQYNLVLDRVASNGTYMSSTYDGDCPNAVTSATDGYLYVADSCTTIYRTSITGIATAESPTGGTLSGPTSIVQGPDGAIWIAGGTNIDRFDPATGILTNIPVPNNMSAQSVAAGPDNAIWFTANVTGGIPPAIPAGPGEIGRIPMNGTGPFTPSVIVMGTGAVTGITAGVDNAMWYLDYSGNRVGRVSTAAGNAATTYAIPTTGAGPMQIVRGPDGSLWFTEYTANQIGHLVP